MTPLTTIGGSRGSRGNRGNRLPLFPPFVKKFDDGKAATTYKTESQLFPKKMRNVTENIFKNQPNFFNKLIF